MTRRRLLASLDTARVERGIRAAESACAIELRVSIAGLFWGDPEKLARRVFARLGMAATSRRNGVLVLIAPWRRKVVIFADAGITAKVSPALWSGTVAGITSAFAAGQFTEGLVQALADLAHALAPHFPPEQRRNELPEQIDRGRSAP
jgi:uncharacterized membrane protein YgcG